MLHCYHWDHETTPAATGEDLDRQLAAAADDSDIEAVEAICETIEQAVGAGADFCLTPSRDDRGKLRVNVTAEMGFSIGAEDVVKATGSAELTRASISSAVAAALNELAGQIALKGSGWPTA